MRGIRTPSLFVVSLLAATLTMGGCKKGKDSANAADAKETSPSGTTGLEGMYRYMADAGLFLDCATGQQWPVAMEGDNAALERAYGKAKVAPGSPLLVTVEGRLELRPKMDGEGTETTLIVDRFVRTRPGETCDGMIEVRLEDTYWALIELNGKRIASNAQDRTPYLELSSKKSSAFGFGGCNRFFGSYEATERSLKLGALGATRMACPEGMEREQELFTALAATTRYEIHGSELLLFADKALLARFEARQQPE